MAPATGVAFDGFRDLRDPAVAGPLLVGWTVDEQLVPQLLAVDPTTGAATATADLGAYQPSQLSGVYEIAASADVVIVSWSANFDPSWTLVFRLPELTLVGEYSSTTNSVIVTLSEGFAAMADNELAVFDSTTGEIARSFPAKGGLTMGNDRMLFTDSGGDLVGYDTATGAVAPGVRNDVLGIPHSASDGDDLVLWSSNACDVFVLTGTDAAGGTFIDLGSDCNVGTSAIVGGIAAVPALGLEGGSAVQLIEVGSATVTGSIPGQWEAVRVGSSIWLVGEDGVAVVDATAGTASTPRPIEFATYVVPIDETSAWVVTGRAIVKVAQADLV